MRKEELEMSINIRVVTDNCELWMNESHSNGQTTKTISSLRPICVHGARRILVEASFWWFVTVLKWFFLLNLLLTPKKRWITQQVIFHIFLALSLSLWSKFKRSSATTKKKKLLMKLPYEFIGFCTILSLHNAHKHASCLRYKHFLRISNVWWMCVSKLRKKNTRERERENVMQENVEIDIPNELI